MNLSPQRVAARYLRRAGKVKYAVRESDGDRLYDSFKTHYQEVSDHIDMILDPTATWERYGKNHPSAYYLHLKGSFGPAGAFKSLAKSIEMAQFINAGRPLAQYIVEYKSIPKAKVKKAEQALRVFLTMRRVPRNLETWWKRNAKHMQLFLESRGWPAKSAEVGSEEKYQLGPFEVHNTIHAEGAALQKTNKAIESAVKFLKSSRIPRKERVLYGPVMVVGKLMQPRTLAWYYPNDDTVYLRAHTKVGKGEVHNLIHELGHRYWRKFFDPGKKRAWFEHHSSIKNGSEAEVGELDDDHMRQLKKLDDLKPGDEFPRRVKGFLRGGPPIVDSIVGSPGNVVGWVIRNAKGKRGMVGKKGVVETMKASAVIEKKFDHFPTNYASTDAEEHFCEAFAMYAMNSLPVEHKDAFERIVLGGGR